MTKQEQIEEMCEAIASMICQIYNPQCDEYEPHTCSHCYANDTLIGDFAEMLYNAGYRKIPENAVVLTKEEYIDLSRNYVTEQIEQVRKETAEKILNELIDSSNKITFFDCRMALGLDKLAKQYGVEVEE